MKRPERALPRRVACLPGRVKLTERSLALFLQVEAARETICNDCWDGDCGSCAHDDGCPCLRLVSVLPPLHRRPWRDAEGRLLEPVG